MNIRRSDFYAPAVALMLALVALMASSAALDQSSDSLEALGRRFTDAQKSPPDTSSALLAANSRR